VFTPGFKYFFGLATLGLIGAFVYGLSSGDATGPDYFGFVDRNAIVGLISLGWKGNIGSGLGFYVLIFFACSAAFIGFTAVAFRDADVESVAQLGSSSTLPPAQRPTAPSYLPPATAIGVGVLLIGLVLDTIAIWIVGLALLAVVAVEWALTAWADRSTGNPATNSALRSRVLAPLEIPMLAAAVMLVLALSISRILLAVSVNGAVLVAGLVALAIFLVALLAAFKPDLNRRTISAVAGAVLLAIVSLGIISAAIGPRDIEHHGGDGEEHSDETTVNAE
jgi:hypothetical protein